MKLGQKVRLIRARRNIKTQARLSEMTGLSRGYLSLLEQADTAGDRKVSDLKKIATAGKVPPSYLLLDDAPEPDWDAPFEGDEDQAKSAGPLAKGTH